MQCHMVHAIPGRIRLRVPALKYLADGAAQMEMYLQDQPGITAVSITRICASVTLTYDPARWTPEALQQVFAGLSPAALQHYQSPRLVRPVTPPQSTMSWAELLLSSAAMTASVVGGPFTPLLLPLLVSSAWSMFSRAYAAIIHHDRLNVKVAVVGDGINDSPALAQADVGIAVHGGTDVAQETAYVALREGGLGKIPLAINIAREGVQLIRQNGRIVAIPNTLALGLALVGVLGPIGGTLISNGSALLALGNALRPLLTSPARAPGAQTVHADDHTPLTSLL